MTYDEEPALDDAIVTATKNDSPEAIVIGWVIAVAYRLPGQENADGVAHAYFAPSGQPKYATVGLLGSVSDWLRGIGEDEA